LDFDDLVTLYSKSSPNCFLQIKAYVLLLITVQGMAVVSIVIEKRGTFFILFHFPITTFGLGVGAGTRRRALFDWEKDLLDFERGEKLFKRSRDSVTRCLS